MRMRLGTIFGTGRCDASVCWCVAALAMVLAGVEGAFEVPLGMRFEKPNAEGLPAGWCRHA